MGKYLLLIVLLLALACESCSIKYSTRYRVTDKQERTYYTDSFKLTDSTISFSEYNRNGAENTFVLGYPYEVLDNTIPNKDTRKYIRELQSQGYSKGWATHKALVECGQIPEDDEYLAIQED